MSKGIGFADEFKRGAVAQVADRQENKHQVALYVEVTIIEAREDFI
ncbi:hypothetical protein [Profundibacter sp.]